MRIPEAKLPGSGLIPRLPFLIAGAMALISPGGPVALANEPAVRQLEPGPWGIAALRPEALARDDCRITDLVE